MAEFLPPGATAEDLFIEKTNLDGVVFSAVAFGGLFTLAFECIQLIGTKRHKSEFERILFGYSFLLLALSTIGFAGSMKFNDMTFIDDRNYPGGPNAFAKAFYSHWINLMSFTCYVLLSWVSDGFVLYRGYILWDSNYWIMLFPSLVYFGSIGISIPVINSARNGTFWNEDITKLITTYWSLTVASNLLSTILIVVRLVTGSKQNSAPPAKPGGKTPSSKPISVISTLIESASLSSAYGISFIVSYGLKSPFQSIPQRSLSHVQGISALLIVLRMLKGKSWPRTGTASNRTEAESSVAFRGHSANHHTVNLAESFPLNNIDVKPNRETLNGEPDGLHYKQYAGSDSTSSKAEMFDTKVGHAM